MMISDASASGTSSGTSPAVSGFGSSTVVASTSAGPSASTGTPLSYMIPPSLVADDGAGPSSGIDREEFISTTVTMIAITAATTPTIVHVIIRERRFSAANWLACACRAASRELAADLFLAMNLYLSEDSSLNFERLRVYRHKLYIC